MGYVGLWINFQAHLCIRFYCLTQTAIDWSAEQGPGFQKRSWLRWMALRSVLVWVRAERPPTAKRKSSSLTSKQARCGPIILNWLAHTDCERVGPHQSYLQMAVCWARSRFTGVNRAAQARIINRSSNRSHI